MVSLPNHPIAPPSGVIATSRVVLYAELGAGPHPCHWCGEPVDWKQGLKRGALIVDHFDFNKHNNTPENLLVSCIACNCHRRNTGKNRLIQPGELTVLRNGRPTRAISRNCEYCGNEFLTTPAETKNGRGRFCSKECGYENRSPGHVRGYKKNSR